jgi:hypothetical protein
MAVTPETSRFIRSTFRSIWSLELLLFLRAHAERPWSEADLVKALHGSELLVARSLQALFAAGLIDLSDDGTASYNPATRDLDAQVDATAVEYARSPDAVRRAIIAAAGGGDLAAFADAFRLRKD